MAPPTATLSRLERGCRSEQSRFDDYIGQDNPVRVVDAFVEELKLRDLGLEGAEATARSRCARRQASLRWSPSRRRVPRATTSITLTGVVESAQVSEHTGELENIQFDPNVAVEIEIEVA